MCKAKDKAASLWCFSDASGSNLSGQRLLEDEDQIVPPFGVAHDLLVILAGDQPMCLYRIGGQSVYFGVPHPQAELCFFCYFKEQQKVLDLCHVSACEVDGSMVAIKVMRANDMMTKAA